MNRDHNQEIYDNLTRRIYILNENFKSVFCDNEIQVLFENQIELRKRINELFLNYYGETCRKCGGSCCRSYIWLYKKDLLLFLSQKTLNLPEPDWNFVNSKNCCIFLNSFGCILKEFRPWQCLKHICNELSLNAKILEYIGSLVNEYELNVNRFAGEIQRKWYLVLD